MSHTFFMRYPEAFYEFYKDKMMCLDAKPNAAHLKLAELEQAGKLTAVVTQNIDGPSPGGGQQDGMGAAREHPQELLYGMRQIL